MLVAGLGCGLALPAIAQQPHNSLLDGPRAAGQVGERYDGYAMVRGSAPADVQALVDQVNGRRRALYTEKAAAQKVPVDAIGRIYAIQIINHLPPGSWVLGEDGKWVQK